MTFLPIQQEVSVCTTNVDTEGKGSAALAFVTGTCVTTGYSRFSALLSEKKLRPDKTK